MDNQRIYNQLISRAKDRGQVSGYTESHHIIPLCHGGTNNNDNLVALTAREHYLAHWLLYKIYRTSKLCHAWYSMSRVGVGQQRHYNSRFYGYCKTHRARHLSEDMKGEKNHFYGKTHTDETKAKISRKNRGKVRSDETKKLWSTQRKGVAKTDDHKSKIGRKGLVMLTNGKETVRIPKDQQQAYIDMGYLNPAAWHMKHNPTQYTCSVCGASSKSKGNITRWHNENCKHRNKQ